MPTKTDLATLNCSLARALGTLGDGWSLLIIRDALFGARRFTEFKASLGMATNILALRLENLVAQGIMERSGSQHRPLYALTEKGRALLAPLYGLMIWGDRWVSGNRPPMLISDSNGTALLAPVLRSVDGSPVDLESLQVRPGPGANARTRAHFAAREIRPSPSVRPRKSSRGETK